MKFIVPDFETRSACDLKKCGAWRYAEDPTTEVLCLRWAYSDRNEIGLWLPGMPFPPGLAEALESDDTLFVPHNAAFEKAIWRRYCMPVLGWPDIANSRWDDSMARCANLVIPQDLDMAVRVLRLPALKDTDASKFTINLSRFDRKGYWQEITPEVQKIVSDYCADDCRAQLGLRERVGTLSPAERQVWLLDQRINERGVRLDLDLIAQMQRVVDGATAPMLARFQAITGIPKLQSPKLKEWCHEHGAALPDLTKETLAEWLDNDPDAEDYDTLSDNEICLDQRRISEEVREALRIKQLVGSASVKKLQRANSCVSLDGRARGLLRYHGAGPGLWAGRLLQPQNFPRGTITAEDWEDAEEFTARKVSAILTGDYRHVETFIGPAVETVVSSLRHIIIASRERELVVGDFAGIQARLALAAAGQHDKTRMMADGVDVYIDLACDIFNMEKPDWKNWDKARIKAWVKEFKKNYNELRQYGKNSILGLGFQMGAPKFLKRYCKGKDLDFAKRIVKTYREEWAPEVPKLWRGLEEAAIKTVWERTPHEAYGVLFKLEDMWMSARLPSGRKIYYFSPKPTRKEMPWSTEEDPDVRRSWSYQARKMGKWVNIDAFGGLLTENLASGLARDLLVSAMFKAEKNGLPIVLTVHDEIVADAKPSSGVANAVTLKQIMEDRPQWTIDMGVPVESETWSGERYKK